MVAGVLPIFESRYVSPNYVLLGCGLSLVLYFALLPFIKSLALLLLTTAIASVFWAWMDVRANALLFAVWGDKVGPYLQACAPALMRHTIKVLKSFDQIELLLRRGRLHRASDHSTGAARLCPTEPTPLRFLLARIPCTRRLCNAYLVSIAVDA